jgi:hypothetical protein
MYYDRLSDLLNLPVEVVMKRLNAQNAMMVEKTKQINLYL